MSSWGLENRRSVHGDDRRMLRIISPKKDPTSDRDPHHHGNGCRGRTCSWTELKILCNPCWRYALEAIMYDDISYVFMNKDSPRTLSMMCISKYVTCLWDYALSDNFPKRSLVERVVWTRNRVD